MAWSIFTEGGGPGAAVTWAENLESSLGVPQSPQNTQFIYDWETSEGGGGKFNPLNQGADPGHPELTSSAPASGGAADYVSWQGGLQGSTDYLNMPAYSGVLAGLQNSDYASAASALWASTWASSHYGYGKNWSYAIPPSDKTALSVAGGGVSTSSIVTAPASAATSIISKLFGLPTFSDFTALLERLGLILLGAALILIGVFMMTQQKTFKIADMVIKTETGGKAGAANTQRTQNKSSNGS